MSKLIDEFREEIVKDTTKEIAVRMLKDELPIEKVAEYSSLSIEEIILFQKELLETKSSVDMSYRNSQSKNILEQDESAIIQEQKVENESMENKTEDTNSIFYNSSDIAKKLGCSLDAARTIMNRRDFPLIKVGKNYKVYKVAFEKWAMERRD